MLRKAIFIFLLLAALPGAFYVENTGFFTDLKKSLRNRDLPSPLLNFGKRGQIMRELGLKYVVPVDEGGAADVSSRNSRMSLDLSKLSYGKNWVDAKNLSPEKMISTKIADASEIARGVPVISIYASNDALYNENTGIYANYLKKGRNWERPCFVSFFNNGKLLFGSGAGIRLHGGTSRRHDLKSFRIYLRPGYGRESFGQGVFFKGRGDPFSHLIIKKVDTGYGFINSLAYDISRQIGCYAVYSEPARFYLNGKLHGSGNFELIEHLSKEYLVNHFGHKNFIFVRIKGRKDRPSEYRDLYDWARSSDSISLNEAEKRIDIDNFTKYWISNIFCANSDPYQGLALLDRSTEDPKWFWVMWDMDHSFRNIYEKDKKYLWQQERPVNFVVTDEKKETDPRYFIFRKLIFHDSEYRDYFKSEMTKTLNHKLTEKFLSERVNHYASIASDFKMGIDGKYEKIQEFMNRRSEFLMTMLSRSFQLGDFFSVDVKNAGSSSIKIDGFSYRSGYKGFYYDGSVFELDASGTSVKGWLVNNVRYSKKRVQFTVKENLLIVPLR